MTLDFGVFANRFTVAVSQGHLFSLKRYVSIIDFFHIQVDLPWHFYPPASLLEGRHSEARRSISTPGGSS